MRPVFHLALHNLRHAWLRSALSALAVAMGVATLVAAELISQSVTAEIARTAESEAITGFMSEQLNMGLTVIGLVVTIGAGFITFNTFSMAMAQRREDLGRLRASGMTRRQVLAMILAEAGLIGAAGAFLGSGGGIALSRGLIAFVQTTSEMFNRFGTPQVTAGRLVWAGGLGLLVSLLLAEPRWGLPSQGRALAVLGTTYWKASGWEQLPGCCAIFFSPSAHTPGLIHLTPSAPHSGSHHGLGAARTEGVTIDGQM